MNWAEEWHLSFFRYIFRYTCAPWPPETPLKDVLITRALNTPVLRALFLWVFMHGVPPPKHPRV